MAKTKTQPNLVVAEWMQKNQKSMEYWKLRTDMEIQVSKIYFTNGEHYVRGVDIATGKPIDLPYIFFEDKPAEKKK